MIYKDIEEMKAKAKEGDIGAQVELGVSYLYGYGVDIDYVEAFVYLQDAAIKNDGEAQLHLGRMYENGWGIKQDLWTAYSLYRRSYKVHTEGSRKALSNVVDKLADAIPVTGRLTISDDFTITACCERLREYIRMGRIVPFEDDEESNLYISNTNRTSLLKECPFCGECVQHLH